jgi:hypothetical protein
METLCSFLHSQEPTTGFYIVQLNIRSYPIHLSFILILLFVYEYVLEMAMFSSAFLRPNFVKHLMFQTHATCPSHLFLLELL